MIVLIIIVILRPSFSASDWPNNRLTFLIVILRPSFSASDWPNNRLTFLNVTR